MSFIYFGKSTYDKSMASYLDGESSKKKEQTEQEENSSNKKEQKNIEEE